MHKRPRITPNAAAVPDFYPSALPTEWVGRIYRGLYSVGQANRGHRHAAVISNGSRFSMSNAQDTLTPHEAAAFCRISYATLARLSIGFES